MAAEAKQKQKRAPYHEERSQQLQRRNQQQKKEIKYDCAHENTRTRHDKRKKRSRKRSGAKKCSIFPAVRRSSPLVCTTGAIALVLLLSWCINALVWVSTFTNNNSSNNDNDNDRWHLSSLQQSLKNYVTMKSDDGSVCDYGDDNSYDLRYVPTVHNKSELYAFGISRIDAFCTGWDIIVDEWWTHRPMYEIWHQNITHQCFQPIIQDAVEHTNEANNVVTTETTKPKNGTQSSVLYRGGNNNKNEKCNSRNYKRYLLYQKLYNSQHGISTTYKNDSTFEATPNKGVPRANKNEDRTKTYCQQTIAKTITNSGWGLDLSHMVDGLLFAAKRKYNANKSPVQFIHKHTWQYAENTCPAQDWTCYFLNITDCQTNWRGEAAKSDTGTSNTNHRERYYPWFGFSNTKQTLWLLLYATRAQTWIRQYAVQLASPIMEQLEDRDADVTTTSSGRNDTDYHRYNECAIFHVRRGDVVLHGKWSRKYHAIEEYVQLLESYYRTRDQQQQQQQQQGILSLLFSGKLGNNNFAKATTTSTEHRDDTNEDNNNNPSYRRNSVKTVLLLTDDSNALREAQERYPHIRWIAFERIRHKGSEGGWENQIPSNNPSNEVAVLLATAHVLSQNYCPVLVHSKSNLADYYFAIMKYYATTNHKSSNKDNHRVHGNHEESNRKIIRLDLDTQKNQNEIHSLNNTNTVRLSKSA